MRLMKLCVSYFKMNNLCFLVPAHPAHPAPQMCGCFCLCACATKKNNLKFCFLKSKPLMQTRKAEHYGYTVTSQHCCCAFNAMLISHSTCSSVHSKQSFCFIVAPRHVFNQPPPFQRKTNSVHVLQMFFFSGMWCTIYHQLVFWHT